MSAFITDIPVTRKPRNDAEAKFQSSVIEWLLWQKVDRKRFFAVPNGEKRGKAAGARLKTQGVLAGVPDLVFVLPDGRAAFVELKAPKGVMSPAQKDYAAWCVEKRVPHAVCSTLDEVEAALRQWGLFDRDAKFKLKEAEMFKGLSGYAGRRE